MIFPSFPKIFCQLVINFVPRSQLHAAQRDVRQPVDRRPEEAAQVEAVKHHTCHRQTMCKVTRMFLDEVVIGTNAVIFQQLWLSSHEKNVFGLGVIILMMLNSLVMQLST